MENLHKFAARYRVKCDLKDKKIFEERKKLAGNLDRLLAPTIPKFFEGASVFITGGTGFVGKVLTEKLLRSCPGIDKIYFLIRPKKGLNPENRLQELFQSELYEKLNREQPNAINKVIPIVGDVGEINLGLSEDDQMLLQHKVSVVFHSAATVRFDDPFVKTVLLNCRGTREVLELCKSMLKLKVMVHVSTTYCNVDQAVNEEVVYPSHLHWKDVIKVAENDDPYELQILHQKLIGKLPNIYTFTKRIAENIVNDYRHDFPVAIGRPSVVMSTVADPIPGWWDSIIGAPGFTVGLSTGVLRVLYADKKVRMEFFAVDYVIRELILLAWLRGCQLRLSTDPLKTDVVNMTVQDCYDVNATEMQISGKEILDVYPSLGIRKPNVTITRNKLYFMYRLFTAHILFAIVVDALLRVAGQKPRLLKIYRKVQYANNCIEFFLCNSCTSTCENYAKGIAFLKEEDLPHFNQMIAFDYVKYNIDTKIGVDKYVLRQEVDYKRNWRIQQVLDFFNAKNEETLKRIANRRFEVSAVESTSKQLDKYRSVQQTFVYG